MGPRHWHLDWSELLVPEGLCSVTVYSHSLSCNYLLCHYLTKTVWLHLELRVSRGDEERQTHDRISSPVTCGVRRFRVTIWGSHFDIVTGKRSITRTVVDGWRVDVRRKIFYDNCYRYAGSLSLSPGPSIYSGSRRRKTETLDFPFHKLNWRTRSHKTPHFSSIVTEGTDGMSERSPVYSVK